MAREWYYSKSGQQNGPVNDEQIKALIASGQLQTADLVWCEGMVEWAQAQKVEGLWPASVATGPKLPPPLPAAAAAVPPVAMGTGTVAACPSGPMPRAGMPVEPAVLRRTIEALRQSLVEQVLDRQADSLTVEPLITFREEHARLQEQLKQLQQRLHELDEAKAEYGSLEKACQRKSAELASAETQLKRFARPLGQAAFAGFLAGQVPAQHIFNERSSVHKKIEELQAEHGRLEPPGDAGVVQKMKARTQQVVLAGRIELEKMKIGKLDEQIGWQLIASDQGSSVCCNDTTEVLDKLAKHREEIVRLRQELDHARDSFDKNRQLAAQALQMAVIDSVQSFDLERKRSEMQIAQTESTRIALERDLPDRLLVSELFQNEGELGQLLRDLRDAQGRLRQLGAIPDHATTGSARLERTSADVGIGFGGCRTVTPNSRKIADATADLATRGISPFVVAPPVWRLAWRLRVELPPPHFMEFGTLALFSGCLFGILWIPAELIMGWGSQGATFVVITAALAGALFGLVLAGYYRNAARRLGLPPWVQYPQGGPSDRPTARISTPPVIPVATPALWNPMVAGLWSLLFSWAFGSFLLARNWIALGNGAKAKRCMIWFYAFFLYAPLNGIIANWAGLGAYSDVDDLSLLRVLTFFAAILTPYFIWAILEVNPQTKHVKQRFGEQYLRKPWGRPILVGLSAYFVGVVCLTSVHFLRSTLHERGFGQKVEFGTSEVYYKPPVTEAEAREVGRFLSGVGYFDQTPKTAQVRKQSQIYEVRFVLKEGAEANPEIVTEFTDLAGRLSRNVCGDAEVEVHLCNDRLKTTKKVTSKDAIDFGRELSFGKAKLFFKLPVTESEARRLGEYLVGEKFFKPNGRYQIAKKEGVYQFRFFAKVGIGLDQQFVTGVKVFASQLSQNVFEGTKVEIHLCDERLKTTQVVVP